MTSNQYLTFRLDQETYALEICKVREILDYSALTRIPLAPGYMRGVINLRGSVVPVVDLRRALDMGQTDQTTNAYIIIAEIRVGGQTVLLGALADAVQEVIDLDPAHIESPPALTNEQNSGFIQGMGKRGEDFIIIIDISRIFSTDELSEVQKAAIAA